MRAIRMKIYEIMCSIVSDSDPKSSDIEVSSLGFCEVSSDHTYSGDEMDDNGCNTVNDATRTANATILNWTINFTGITFEPFTQDSGPSLPGNFGVSMARALDYFNLLFKPEIFSDTNKHSNSYAIFKQGLTGYYHLFQHMQTWCDL